MTQSLPKRLFIGVNIKGIVIDKTTSEPIIGATLTLSGPSGSNVEPWVTGEATGDQAAAITHSPIYYQDVIPSM